MTNMSTKKALLLSVLSMLICVAMLVGTTFAWFTDSVTSGKNTIKAGNLDVELKYSEDLVTWNTVQGATDLLDPNALWEPGHAEVVYLQVSNLGTLALKYQLSMNIYNEVEGTNVAGDTFKLSEHLMYGVVDVIEKFADRDAAIAAVKENATALSDYSRVGDLEASPTDVDTIALVVYMPTTVGNEANYKTGTTAPSVELGIELLATQKVSEEDFFGNDYDENAVYADTFVDSANGLLDAIENAEDGETIALTGDVDLNDLFANVHFNSTGTVDPKVIIPAGKNVALDLAGYTLSASSKGTGKNYDMFDVRGTLTVMNGKIVTKHIGENMGWNNSTNVFNVTAGGVLNLANVTAQNLGGSDMAFVAHLNNWGEATLNVTNSNLFSTYCAVRVFNSGYDMNNVNITGSTLSGTSMAFWVHNYTVVDFGTEDKAISQAKLLNLNFINAGFSDDKVINEAAGNTYNGKIRFGFTNGEVINEDSKVVSAAGTAKELDTVLKEGNDVILKGDLKFNASETTASSGYGATGIDVKGSVLDGNGNSLGINNWGTWDAAVNTTGGTIKNITINSGMRGIFMGGATADVYIDNVIIDGTIYTFNSDGGDKNYGVYISNSTLNGWTSFSNVHKEVVFTNCNFGEGSGYAFCRPYNASVFKNCVFEEGFEFDTSKANEIVFENCYYGDTLITAENAVSLAMFYNGVGSLTVK